jgi:hypothetical protein
MHVLHTVVIGVAAGTLACDSNLRAVAAAVLLAGGLQQGLQGLGAGGRWGTSVLQ